MFYHLSTLSTPPRQRALLTGMVPLLLRKIQWGLPGDDADLHRIVELGRELFAVFPGETECAYVGDTDPGYDVANGRGTSWIEFSA